MKLQLYDYIIEHLETKYKCPIQDVIKLAAQGKIENHNEFLIIYRIKCYLEGEINDG